MSFKFTFREITPEDTEILRILKLRNAKPEEHICCEILRGDGITMKTWYTFEVWQVEIDGQIHRFAAGEFSNCVWGFYLEKNG